MNCILKSKICTSHRGERPHIYTFIKRQLLSSEETTMSQFQICACLLNLNEIVCVNMKRYGIGRSEIFNVRALPRSDMLRHKKYQPSHLVKHPIRHVIKGRGVVNVYQMEGVHIDPPIIPSPDNRL